MGKSNRHDHAPLWRGVMLAVVATVFLSAIFAPTKAQIQRDTTPIVPTIKNADRHQKDRIFLEHADRLDAREFVDYQILTGNVLFRKGDMFMYCDSAHLYEATNSIEAFGNVRMEQGDTLFVYADELVYSDSTELAILYANEGKKVRLINRDVELQTNPFYYDLGIDLGYYDNNGVLTDKKNRLTSIYGEYAPNSKEALFRDNVHLQSLSDNDTLDIFTEQLYYNTQTHVAEMDVPSIIVNRDGRIYTDSATYNTETSYADLYRRSVVVTKQNNRLIGDSLKYDRNEGFGEAFGDVVLIDSAHQMMLSGDYGFYNELTDSAFVTGRALAKEYSQGDTLYLHSDTIRTFAVITPGELVDSVEMPADTSHLVVAAHKARFYRSDMQGISDSMTFVQTDSILYLNRHPIVWSENKQIFGNVIELHLNDSTIDWARFPDFGFVAEEVEEGFYQQLTGKEMLATFENGQLRRLDINGNVEGLSFPMESDSTYNKFATLESSFMVAWFKGQSLDWMKTWPESTSVITPLYLSKRSQLYLRSFKWFPNLRPVAPMDVFTRSKEFIDYMNQPDESKKTKRKTPAKPSVSPPETIDGADNTVSEIQSAEEVGESADTLKEDDKQKTVVDPVKSVDTPEIN